MSKYYNAQRQRGLYTPGSCFKLSRSKLELFIECPRCFYLDRVIGVGRPPGFPFSLNSAVDALLKKEFESYRSDDSKKHPLIEKNGIDAKPVFHDKLETWRSNFKGIEYFHKKTNLIITGAIDDLWINSKGEYIVVDYKATSKNKEITALDEEWQIGYKRQMEIYQWLLKKNGLKVSNTGYFVYCNGMVANRSMFDNKLDFSVSLIPYYGNDNWVEECVENAYSCLNRSSIPEPNVECDYCAYIDRLREVF